MRRSTVLSLPAHLVFPDMYYKTFNAVINTYHSTSQCFPHLGLKFAGMAAAYPSGAPCETSLNG
jgi:hypothetical protein